MRDETAFKQRLGDFLLEHGIGGPIANVMPDEFEEEDEYEEEDEDEDEDEYED